MAECPLCYLAYDAEKAPAAYPCGHVHCLPCVSELTALGCPTCRWTPKPTGSAKPTNAELVTKLFMDLASDEGEAQNRNRATTALTLTQVNEAMLLADRLKALGQEVGIRGPEVLEAVLGVKRWIEGVESIKDEETKVALARLTYMSSEMVEKLNKSKEKFKELTILRGEAASLRIELQISKGTVTTHVQRSADLETALVQERTRSAWAVETANQQRVAAIQTAVDQAVGVERARMQAENGRLKQQLAMLNAHSIAEHRVLVDTTSRLQRTDQAIAWYLQENTRLKNHVTQQAASQEQETLLENQLRDAEATLKDVMDNTASPSSVEPAVIGCGSKRRRLEYYIDDCDEQEKRELKQ
ncbi:hypothetical protein FRB97_008789 [Tulasnella sp. 331]|nr:hypothetical protein FRB97_008789 [Tulasnella sp. 331]